MGKKTLFNKMKIFSTTVIATLLLAGCDSKFVVLDPKGPVAEVQYRLIILSAILCAVVVIPVLAILWYIVWRYRDKPGNKAPYTPHWDDSKVLEIIWWGIPIVIIGMLGFLTAKDTYALAKPPVTDSKPITIQVTSLDWKWLFQYPDQKIATVNYVEIPAGVPVHFQLTSDAPMNSFWIPALGGQTYTMPGMAMGMWLQADHPGVFDGKGANFSGEGFAHMQFKVEAKPQSEFNHWVEQVKETAPELTKEGYEKLATPGLAEKASYSSYPEELFDETVDKNGGKYMKDHHNMNEQQMNHGETEQDHQHHDMSGMEHDMSGMEHDMSGMEHDMSGMEMKKN